MIHHISVSVNDPLHVATVMAEIFQGYVIPFPVNPGSYMALAADAAGTAIEFYPAGSEILPDSHQGEAGFRLNPQPTQYCAFHAAISVPISLEEIERIGDREGWRVLFASRDGMFDVVEFWVENRLMLELLTPTMAVKYQAVLSPEHLPALVDQLTLVEAR
ncbi:hypothetical protein H6F75_19435 [Nodosilinea sp. FACHB-131]|uniref:hypothetical protein n=1 Tax=Cyanophyceae TaxID=3028117 RepID=UPI0016843D25|nr:hypothetical protein [Nodosilinea sp. FACHB-131]MBD1875659.1 hypothetical protein [Nodosilinea sp. FACHB-131]